MHKPWKGILLASVSRRTELSRPTALLLQAAAKAACSYAFVFLPPHKRVNIFLETDLACRNIFLQLILDVFLYRFFISTDRIHIISSAPKMSVTVFVLQIRYLSKIIRLLFPFKYPINCATLILGGMLTNMCMWSGHASASRISTLFCSHSFLRIWPMSALIFPYISFLRYFGANTMVFSITQTFTNINTVKC